jgi:hypothetical protein
MYFAITKSEIKIPPKLAVFLENSWLRSVDFACAPTVNKKIRHRGVFFI